MDIKIKQLWQHSHDVEDCLQTATKAWRPWPFSTTSDDSTCAMWQAMIAKYSIRRSVAHAKSAYKLMELVGRFLAEDQWSAACALACYRASEELRSEVFCEEYNTLDELYERITHSRVEDDELQNVKVFWGKLHDYRGRECRRLLQSSDTRCTILKQRYALHSNTRWPVGKFCNGSPS